GAFPKPLGELEVFGPYRGEGRRLRHLEQRRLLETASTDPVEIWEMCEQRKASDGVVPVDPVCPGGAFGDNASEPDPIVACLGLDRRHDPIHGEDRVEIVGGNDETAFSVLQG